MHHSRFRFLRPGVTEFGGTYSIELCPGTSLNNVPIQDRLVISGDTIKVEYGQVRLLPDSVCFMVGDNEKSTFYFKLSDLISIKTGEGDTVWEREAETLLV